VGGSFSPTRRTLGLIAVVGGALLGWREPHTLLVVVVVVVVVFYHHHDDDDDDDDDTNQHDDPYYYYFLFLIYKYVYLAVRVCCRACPAVVSVFCVVVSSQVCKFSNECLHACRQAGRNHAGRHGRAQQTTKYKVQSTTQTNLASLPDWQKTKQPGVKQLYQSINQSINQSMIHAQSKQAKAKAKAKASKRFIIHQSESNTVQ